MSVNIQWYPGHMTKAKRQMQEDIKLVDLILELADARVPNSSRNPDLAQMGKDKARIVLLNKADLADERENKKWQEYFRSQGILCVLLDARNRGSLKSVSALVREACSKKMERDARRGIKNRPVRAMVVGIPNVGKSTFINSYAGKACTKTGNKPGVTKGKQWVRLDKDVQLLDTPGVLWAKFEDPLVGQNLALIGSVKDDILNREELAMELLEFLKTRYPGRLAERYGVEEEQKTLDVFYAIGKNRGCLEKGSEVSYAKTAALLLDEFRGGKLGRITLERPIKEQEDEKADR